MNREDMPTDFSKYLYDWTDAILKPSCPQNVADNIAEAFGLREQSITYLGVYEDGNERIYRFTHPDENVLSIYKNWRLAWIVHGYSPAPVTFEEGI